jgi:glycosyltransferase involved in cell wall biosynthesis
MALGRPLSPNPAPRQEAFVSHRYNSEKPMIGSLPPSPVNDATPLTIPSTGIHDQPVPQVSIIIPARNEEANLGACLESLTAQTGVDFEIIVVDDASTDRTREIAQSFTGVQVISPQPLPAELTPNRRTGKNNALIAGTKVPGTKIAGTKQARAPWLLFTDADTIHQPGSLARALDEAEREQADLLSYSPEQIVVTFAERAVMPVLFAELAARYPLRKVRDQNSGVVAANGQYILVSRAAYEAVGGHAAVAEEILEDVALARLFRAAGKRVYFRYGADAVRTRMYRTWPQLREGWTKNLALLFPQSEFLMCQSLALWLVAWGWLAIAVSGALTQHFVWILSAAFWLLVYRRINAAHFKAANNLIAMLFGFPIFAYLLHRSRQAYANGRVCWKGRAYSVDVPGNKAPVARQTAKPLPKLESQELRAES